MKNLLEETKQQIDSQKVEQQKLQKIIADTDAEVFQLKKQLEQVGRETASMKRVNTERILVRILSMGQTFREGGERAGQPGQAPAAAQQRVLPAV